MRTLWNSLFLRLRFFYIGVAVSVCFVLSFFYPSILPFATLLLVLWLSFSLFDLLLLAIPTQAVTGKRRVAEQLSHSDENPIELKLENNLRFALYCTLEEVLPEQLQIAIEKVDFRLGGKQFKTHTYTLKPKFRGEHTFGQFLVYARSLLGLVERKHSLGQEDRVRVFPSFLHLHKKRFAYIHQKSALAGNNLRRKLGHSQEFEQIRNYVKGDDIRSINWKATAKAGSPLVNQYQEERSQSMYCIIDKGRSMRHAFEGNTLLDIAINSSLVFSQVMLDNKDRVGLCSFSNGIEDFLKPDNKNGQMNKLLSSLYNLKTDFKESDFGSLYVQLKRKVSQRSMIFLYTQFTSMDAMQRQLPYLRAINKMHVLVVIFFKDPELMKFTSGTTPNGSHYYDKAIAQKFLYEQALIVKELKKHGLKAILTSPNELTVNTINNYLALKAKALL